MRKAARIVIKDIAINFKNRRNQGVSVGLSGVYG